MHVEKWREIPSFPLYEVSNKGRVRNVKSGRILAPRIRGHHGYNQLCLYVDGIKHYVYAHRLVAEAFIPNPNNLPYVNHINGDKSCNEDWNLEWVTHSENMKHAIKTGLNSAPPTPKSIPIIQFTKSGEFVAEYQSIREAGKATGIFHQNIWACVKGKYKSAGGFIWREACN